MQRRQEPIEGAVNGQATTPTRTGDDVATSNVTAQEAKTMAALPVAFIGVAVLVAVVVVILLIVLR